MAEQRPNPRARKCWTAERADCGTALRRVETFKISLGAAQRSQYLACTLISTDGRPSQQWQ